MGFPFDSSAIEATPLAGPEFARVKVQSYRFAYPPPMGTQVWVVYVASRRAMFGRSVVGYQTRPKLAAIERTTKTTARTGTRRAIRDVIEGGLPGCIAPPKHRRTGQDSRVRHSDRRRQGSLVPAVLVDAAARLPADAARPHILAQECRRPELRVSRLAEEDLHHVEADVEAGIVREFERPHGHVRPQLHRLVDVLGARDALLEKVERLVHHRNEEAIHHETRGLLHLDGLLAEPRAQILDQGDRWVARLGAADHLDEFHHRRRVEEVHADDAVGALRRVRHLRDAQRRRVGRKDHVGRAQTIQLRVEIPFDVHLFEDRLDEDLGPRHRLLQIDDATDLGHDSVHFGRGHLPLPDALRERFADPSKAAVHEALLDVSHRDLESRRGTRLRDPGAHRPRPDHRDLSHVGRSHETTRPAWNIDTDLKNALLGIRQTHIGLVVMRRPGPPMRSLKSLTVVLAIAVAFASILFVSPPVAATQNHPTWTQGDFWVYTRTQGSATSTIRIDVQEKS